MENSFEFLINEITVEGKVDWFGNVTLLYACKDEVPLDVLELGTNDEFMNAVNDALEDQAIRSYEQRYCI